MKATTFVLAIFFILVGIRAINVLNDILLALVCGGVAILCIFLYLNYDNFTANDELEE